MRKEKGMNDTKKTAMVEVLQYDENLSVKVQLLNIYSYPIHSHRDFQILYVLEGELSLRLFYATYRLHPGSIHIIHSEDVHSIESITDQNLVLVLSFDSNYFQSIFPHFITTVFITNIEEGTFKKRDTLRDQIFAIVAEEYDRSAGYVSRINNGAVALINTLMNHFRGFVIDPSEKAFIHKTSHDYMQVERISRIIQYVYENYPYKISLTEIAETEQMSPYYLSHIFHKLVGMNFRNFLSMVRVEMSEVSILSTNKSISQIAQDVGFSDAKYYVSRFYEHMGCHPKEYRSRYGSKIYGLVLPDIEEYPLSRLKPMIGKYTRYPVFKEEVARLEHIEIDCSTKMASERMQKDAPSSGTNPGASRQTGKLPPMGSMLSVLEDLSADLAESDSTVEDASRLYQNVLPQQAAIETLAQLVEQPEAFRFPTVCLFDGSDFNQGMLTAKGLRKPMYHLAKLLETLPADIMDAGPNYITLCGNREHDLLVFNPSRTDPVTIDIVARNITTNYRLTKYHLQADKSCLNYWAQLNFSSCLDAEDIRNINYMSGPYVEYAVVPRREQYYTSVELAPHDIMLLKFSEK